MVRALGASNVGTALLILVFLGILACQPGTLPTTSSKETSRKSSPYIKASTPNGDTPPAAKAAALDETIEKAIVVRELVQLQKDNCPFLD